MRVQAAAVFIACAGTLARAQQTIPVQRLGPVEATAPERIDVLANIRPLSDGRLFVVYRGRTMLFREDLSSYTLAADSTKLTPGTRATGAQLPMVPYVGDSILLVDRNASSFLVVDPTGKVVRSAAAPRANDLERISGWPGSRGAFADDRGNLIYLGDFPRGPSDAGINRDSFPVIRANFEKRTADTIASVRIGSVRIGTTTTRNENGQFVRVSTYKPFPVMDQWVAFPDGAVGVIRGADYHVDWYYRDGSKTSSAKLPFDWRRISDEEKKRVVDSIVTYETERARQDSIREAQRPPRSAPTMVVERFKVVSPTEVTDYYPPVRESGIRGDGDGNLWILPTTSTNASGGLLYDVVNRRGELFERVQLPSGCALSAVGRGGVVYLVCEGTRLERRRIVRPAQ